MSDLTPRDQLAQIIRAHIDCDVRGSKMDCGMDYPSPDYTQFGRTEHLADAIVNAGWRSPAHVVSTVEEAEALVEDVLIRDRNGGVWRKECSFLWCFWDGQPPELSEVIPLPATVLWEPEEGE